MTYIDPDTIIFIHQHLTNFFHDSDDPISPPGIKNIESIESAAARPTTTIDGGDAYPSPFLKAAALFHSIAGNHSFHNGNKRTALLSTLYYLSELGYIIEKCDDDEMYEFTRKIAAHEIAGKRQDEVLAIANWLEDNSRKQLKQEQNMKLLPLKDALSRFGYTVRDAGNVFQICKGDDVVTTMLKRGARGGQDYDAPYISGLRKRLNLDSDSGVDSARFYGHKGISEDLNMFTQLRVEVMRRLAKI